MRVSYVALTNSVIHEPVHSTLYVVIVVGRFYRRLSGRSFSCVISGNRSFLYAFDAIAKNGDDTCLGVLLARSGWVEVGLPIDHGTIWLVVHLQPKLRVVLNRKRAFTISYV